jgi:hypothetical protein
MLRGVQSNLDVLVAVLGVLARKWIARRGRTGEVGCEGAVAVGVAAWLVSPELRASIPTMLCYATSRVGRGRGWLGLSRPSPRLRSFPELPALAAFSRNLGREEGRETTMDRRRVLDGSVRQAGGLVAGDRQVNSRRRR